MPDALVVVTTVPVAAPEPLPERVVVAVMAEPIELVPVRTTTPPAAAVELLAPATPAPAVKTVVMPAELVVVMTEAPLIVADAATVLVMTVIEPEASVVVKRIATPVGGTPPTVARVVVTAEPAVLVPVETTSVVVPAVWVAVTVWTADAVNPELEVSLGNKIMSRTRHVPAQRLFPRAKTGARSESLVHAELVQSRMP